MIVSYAPPTLNPSPQGGGRLYSLFPSPLWGGARGGGLLKDNGVTV